MNFSSFRKTKSTREALSYLDKLVRNTINASKHFFSLIEQTLSIAIKQENFQDLRNKVFHIVP